MDASVLTEFIESLLPCTRVAVPDKANVLDRLRDTYRVSHEEVDEHLKFAVAAQKIIFHFWDDMLLPMSVTYL